jgi:hypothetical protein
MTINKDHCFIFDCNDLKYNLRSIRGRRLKYVFIINSKKLKNSEYKLKDIKNIIKPQIRDLEGNIFVANKGVQG